MSFEFIRAEAGEGLRRWVESVWFARGQIEYSREHIAPTGSTVVVLNLGDPIHHATQGPRASAIEGVAGWISGPHDRPALNEPRGATHCYGIVSTPVGCEALFGLPAREIRGRVVGLEAWEAGPGLRNELTGLETARGLARILERLGERTPAAPAPAVQRIARAVACLEADPAVPVADVARRLGVSHAHLDRQFASVVGLSPRRLAAILRMRRLLAGLDVFAEIDWAEQAASHGWYDQSHLVRDFKRYTGATPTAYLASQREHFDHSEAADAGGFVPQGTRR